MNTLITSALIFVNLLLSCFCLVGLVQVTHCIMLAGESKSLLREDEKHLEKEMEQALHRLTKSVLWITTLCCLLWALLYYLCQTD